MRRYFIGVAALLALGTLIAGAAWARDDPAAEQDRPVGSFAEQVSVSWVLVPVVVRNGHGYVHDLGRDDFRLTVDGHRVAFEDFESGDRAPLSLVFLQDLSGSMANGGKLAASRAALAFLVAHAHLRDEFALASFAGERLRVEVPFTRDEAVLSEAMGLWSAYGTTALHDAVAWIPQIALEGRHPKRAVVLVTDGVDNASDIPPDRARQIVRDARLPVYVLGLGRDALPPEEVAAAGTMPGDTYGQLLERLARATGGRYYPVRRVDDVEPAAEHLLEELRHQYVLGFPAAAVPVAERQLKVTVKVPGRVDVYHRRGYLGGPPL